MSIKSQISGFLRKINLLTAAEKIRFYWQKWKVKKDNETFKKQHPDFVLPPEFFIYETYRLNYQWYHDSGKNSALEIVALFSKYFDVFRPGIKVLDWGCGPGRTIRHFPSLLPDAGIYGTDYNEKYIQWCRTHLKGISFSLNKTAPPLPYPDNFFDAIIGFSVFTHLSEKGHHEWINELYRITRPGKFVYVTSQGNAYYSKLSAEEKKLYDSANLVTRQHPDEGNRLYSSFQPPKFIEGLIAGKFEVVEYMPGKFEKNEPSQDGWLLRKR